MKTWCVSVGLALLSAGLARGADWPQYRGPARDDVSAETGLAAQWPAGGPPLAWTYAAAGVGYSGPAVVGDRLYITGDREDSEFLIALDLKAVKDGAPAQAWATKIGAAFQWTGNQWSAGPSATPTVDGDLVYALSGFGDLVCVEAKTGKERWRKSLPADLGAEVNPIGGGPKKVGWGFTWSPMVDGDRLICVPGGPKGTLAALDKKTGDVIWRSTEVTDQAAYTSAMAMDVDGVRQYVVLTNQGLSGVNAKDGKLLWSVRRPRPYGTEVVNSPIVRGPLVYVTVGGVGCELFRIARDGAAFKAEPVYANKNMSNHHGNLLLFDGHVYGHSGAAWACQKFETGEVVWSERKLPGGAVACAGGRLYCYTENDATAALVEASPAGWKETGRMKMPRASTLRKKSGKVWTPPVVSGGKLFLRDQELLFCFDVSGKE